MDGERTAFFDGQTCTAFFDACSGVNEPEATVFVDVALASYINMFLGVRILVEPESINEGYSLTYRPPPPRPRSTSMSLFQSDGGSMHITQPRGAIGLGA